jgi:predicted GNAT superfamily acetyltransferase
MSITYRELRTSEEFEALVDLEMTVWQMDGRGAVPENIMQAIAHTGGSVMGAFDGEQMIGFALAFLAREDGEIYPWSHMAAVMPAYQSQGIGFRVKQAQRDWALRQGYERMGWTFDPLQRRNANFNLRHLGAFAQVYHINFYGEMRDGLNAGLPSDRLQVTWRLTSPRVVAHAEGATTLAVTEAMIEKAPFLLCADESGQPHAAPNTTLDAPVYRVQIPYDAPTMKQTQPELLFEWQLALRAALQAGFAQGYVAVDFHTENKCACYILQHQNG